MESKNESNQINTKNDNKKDLKLNKKQTYQRKKQETSEKSNINQEKTNNSRLVKPIIEKPKLELQKNEKKEDKASNDNYMNENQNEIQSEETQNVFLFSEEAPFEPLKISKLFNFDNSQKQTLKSLIDSFLAIYERHLITKKNDYRCLASETLGIASYFLDLYFQENAFIKIDDPSQNLNHLPISGKVCLIFIKKLSNSNISINFKNDLRKFCKIANRGLGKGIGISNINNSSQLLIYDAMKDTLFVSQPLNYFDVRNGRIKLREDYVEFFEILISFLKN